MSAIRGRLIIKFTRCLRGKNDRGELKGELFQAAWQVSAHVGRIAKGPGPGDEGPAGRSMPGLREAAMASALALADADSVRPRSFMRGRGLANAGQDPAGGDAGDSPRQRHATEGLARFHTRGEPPGFDVFVACWCPPMEPFGGCGHRPPICLKDAWRRGGGPHDLARPAPVGWAPDGPTHIAAIGSHYVLAIRPQKR
jgi:hypothetical protein